MFPAKFSVWLNLLYMTINFLVTEPLRKTCLSADLSAKHSLNYAWLSPPIAMTFGFVLSLIWLQLPVPDVVSGDDYRTLVGCFCMASLLESMAEPLAILAMKRGQNGLYATAQSALLISTKFVALLLILVGKEATFSLCAGQVIGSLLYLIVLYGAFLRLWLRKQLGFNPFLNTVPSLEAKYIRLMGSLMFHSIQKQVMTDGSGYIMTFTKQLSLTEQAVYDAVERLGSLVARIALRPLEESCALYFSSHLKRTENSPVPRNLLDVFVALVRALFTLGLVVSVFSIPYSKFAIGIYGGQLLLNNHGALLLSLYSFYLLVMAINGIVECFAFASMDSEGIVAHGKFFFIASTVHLATNICLMYICGAPGFVLANIANSIIRCAYNWEYIRTLNGVSDKHFNVGLVVPDVQCFTLLFISLFVTVLSGLIFFSTPGIVHAGAHLAVGGVMFVLIMAYLHQSGELYQKLWEKLD